MRSCLLLCFVTIVNAQKFDHYFNDQILETRLFLKYAQKQRDIRSQKDTLNIINTLKKDLNVLNEGTLIYGSYLGNIGYFALQKNKFEEARSYLKQAILHNKKFPLLLGNNFHNYSVLYTKESRIDSALSYHKRSLLLGDDALYTHIDQCKDFKKLDEKTLSRFIATGNETFDPKSRALYDKAMLLKDKGKAKKSIKIFKEALYHEKSNLNRSNFIQLSLSNIIIQLDEQGKFEELISFLKDNESFIDNNLYYFDISFFYETAALLLGDSNKTKYLDKRIDAYDKALYYSYKSGLISDYIELLIHVSQMNFYYNFHFELNSQRSKELIQKSFRMADHAYKIINEFKDSGMNLSSAKKDSILLGEVFDLKSKSSYELLNLKNGAAYGDSAIFYYKSTGQDSLLVDFYFETLGQTLGAVNQLERSAKIVKDLNFICLEYSCDQEQLLYVAITRLLLLFFQKNFIAIIEDDSIEKLISINDDNEIKILGSFLVNALKGFSYLNLGDQKKYQEYFKKNENSRNIIYNDKALEFFNANSKGYKLSQADLDGFKSIILYLDAIYFAYEQNYTKALKSYNKLLKIKNDPFSIKIKALIDIPIIHSNQGNFKKSKKLQHKNKKLITSLNDENLFKFIMNGVVLMEQTGEVDDFNYYLRLTQERIIPQLLLSGHTVNKVKDRYMDIFLGLFSTALTVENYSLALEILAMSKNQNFNFALLNRHSLDQKDLRPLFKNPKTIIGYDLLKEKSSKNEEEINITAQFNFDYLFDMLVVQIYEPLKNYDETLKNGGFFLGLNDSLITSEYGSITNGLKNFRFGLMNDVNEDFSMRLYYYLVEPYFKGLTTKSNFYEDIIIIPDNNFSIIPFEALKDSSGKFLVEKFNITYNQSLKSYHTILRIEDKGIKKPLVFANPNYRTQKIDNGLRGIYNDLDYGNWSSLPFSESEANYIEKFLPNTTTLSGSRANEKNYKLYDLKDYDIIHFATHGIVIGDRPELNAIVLSQDNSDKEDGYLRSEEIEQLEIDADLVVLSACETALGESYFSEGNVGLINSFFIAGARGVVSTLWPVEDKATSVFMGEFYKNLSEGMPTALALSDVKRDFISGGFGEEYKKPLYWAPFIYYGK